MKKLARNNRREWFNPRKQQFLDELRLPMIELVSDLMEELSTLAPEFVRPPEKAMMRIYRDTRFARDKRPYKRNVGVWFAAQGMEKTSGGGFYLHLAPDEFLVAAGCYMPERDQLKKIRAHIAEHHVRFRKLLRAPALKGTMREFEGLELSRAPKGYAPDHPAVDLLRCRQWGFSASLPVEAALSPKLLAEVRTRFRAALPVVRFLNEPLQVAEKPRQPAAFRLF